MDATQTVKSSQPSVASPDGCHVLTLNGLQLEVRDTSKLELVRSITLPHNTSSRSVCLRWSPISELHGSSDRFLLSDENTVRIWDLVNTRWSATIDNGSGGMGKIANAEFGCDDTEVLVFSSFGARVTIWSLWTGRSLEIKDVKFTNRGFGRNRHGRRGLFALLTRPAAQDILSLHIPAGSYGVLKSFVLPTVDAQGLKWSPDGRWFAVWDTPSTGYKILIYTADGNLYRTYTGDYFDDSLMGLGVKKIEWSPSGELLAVAGFERSVTLLSTRTFSPAVYLSHPSTVRSTAASIWQENVTSFDRSFSVTQAPVSPPSAPQTQGDSMPKVGIANMSFNVDGTLLATKDDSMPTVVWIWDLSQLKSRAILLMHSFVKRLSWHKTDPNVLLIQCIQGESILHVWDARITQPQVLRLPSVSFSGKVEAQWIPGNTEKGSVLMLGDTHGFALAFPDGKGESVASVDGENDRSNPTVELSSDGDSLYDILSGKKPPQQTNIAYSEITDFGSPNQTIDDTFRYRRGVDVY